MKAWTLSGRFDTFDCQIGALEKALFPQEVMAAILQGAK